MLKSGVTGSALLDQCLTRLKELGNIVDRTRKLSEGIDWAAPPPPPSSPALRSPPRNYPQVEEIIDSLLLSTIMSGRAPSRCHECHGPLSGYHKGYAHGVGVCELEHYELCCGDIPEGNDRSGHFWKGCPEDFEPQGAFGGGEDDLDKHGGDSEGGVSPERLSNETSGLKITTPKFPEKKSSSGDLRSSKEDLLLEAEMAELQLMEERNRKLEEVRKKKQLAQEQFDRLSRQSKGEGGRSKLATHDSVQQNAEALRTSNRVQTQSRRERSTYQGPTISEMRNDQLTSQRVDSMMGHVTNIPAFSNVAENSQPQPRLKVKHSQPSGHEYGRDPYSPVHQEEEPLYKMVTRTDLYGVEYRQLVKVTPPRPRPEQRQRLVIDGDAGWSFDQSTGCMYRTESSSPARRNPEASLRKSVSGNILNSHQPSRNTGQTPRQISKNVYQVHAERSERFPGIVPLDQADQKEGKQPKSIASHARDMPVEYAKSATAKNINLAMFMYGAISELHSSRIGITAPLDPGVLEAKLQHLMNVINVTCMNASPTDFKPVGWSVGRTYHNLVQAKIDSGRESWIDFENYHRSSPHAAEMVAAEREHRAALNKVKPEKVQERKVEKREDHDKPLCTTWNNFEEEGKYKYESEHPGEKCNRVHECKYCKKKYPGNRTKHQERFCKRKQEDEQ